MKIIKNHRLTAVSLTLFSVALLIAAYRAMAQTAPPPGVTISALGSNQYSIVITNGALTNYELYWTPVLGDSDYPWQLIALNTNGTTNFQVNAGAFSVGFFEATVEQFYNGVPDYELANPNNPSAGALTVTIDSPANGSVLQ
jgi:hypothetical protein